MRVLVDTNLLIAYLLKPREDSFVNILLDEVVEGRVTLLVPEALLTEIEQTVKRKPYLLNMISETQLHQFLVLLHSLCEEIPLITEAIPPITRDPKDDYLIAYAVIGQADYLISGDKDLLILETVGAVSVVDSGQFRQILRNG
ncbi:MAG: putative toxin-antitoxin system toxin component, PIN family [Anaerolineae bacterium]|nr:putative toxin-antitoxin system toxin component, PIN family [Anaerolineae bacterium]